MATDAQWCDQLVAASCTATDDSPDSYYMFSNFSASCSAQCKANSCGSCFFSCTGMIAQTGSVPTTGYSPVPIVGFGVSSVSGAKSCSAFSAYLKSYRVIATNEPPPGGGTCNSGVCGTWHQSSVSGQQCYPSGPVPGWSSSGYHRHNQVLWYRRQCRYLSIDGVDNWYLVGLSLALVLGRAVAVRYCTRVEGR